LTTLPLEAERSLLHFSLFPNILRLAWKHLAAMATGSEHDKIPVGRFPPRVTIDRLDKLLCTYLAGLENLEKGVRHARSSWCIYRSLPTIVDIVMTSRLVRQASRLVTIQP
jgi:hypothetical protein